MVVAVREGYRQRERERQRQRETERERQRQRDSDRNRERVSERDRDRETECGTKGCFLMAVSSLESYGEARVRVMRGKNKGSVLLTVFYTKPS